MYRSLYKIKCLLIIVFAGFTIALTVACIKREFVQASNHPFNSTISQPQTSPSETPEINNKTTGSEPQVDLLRKLLAETNSQAIEEARRQGTAALPVIRTFSADENYRVRQVAVRCAGAIGDPQGADILATGLKDQNVNVRAAAARELSQKPYPAATETVIDVLKKSQEDSIRQLLATAAGFLPGEKTVAALRPLANGDDMLAGKAIIALAKLGDATGHKAFSVRLSAPLPSDRYDALQNLCYVNDAAFVTLAKRLLSDKAKALPIGSAYNTKYRRVADQAVDALVCLLKLQPSFQTSPEKIYTEPEVTVIKNLVK